MSDDGVPAQVVPVGIDIGGTGTKGGLVDLDRGGLIGDRLRHDTPQPATPTAVADTVADLVAALGHVGPVGLTVPGVVRQGVVTTAANIDPSWVGTDALALFERRLGVDCLVLNDADAAGLAEMRFGAAKDHDGVVLVITLGTGIGSALFADGVLVPNTELGHLIFEGAAAERYAAGAARRRDALSWEQWGRRVGAYLAHLERLFSPDLFVIGGGVSKRSESFFGYLEVETPVVAAALRNTAGIVGAALALSEQRGRGVAGAPRRPLSS